MSPSAASLPSSTRLDLDEWLANGGTDLNGDGTKDSADYLQYAEENNLKIYKPLGLFEITPVGLLIMGVGIAYLMFFGRRLLPDYPDESLAEGFNIREYHSEIVVMPGSRLIGQRVFESSLAEMEFRIVKVLRKKRSFVPNTRSVIEEGDVLLVSGSMEDLMAVKDASGIEIHAETKLEDEALQTDDVKIAELLITPKSTLIRRTLKEDNFRQRFGLAVLAIYRHGQSLGRKLGVIRLRAGDMLLVQGSEERLLSLEHGTNLLRLDATEAPSADRRQKGFRALGFFCRGRDRRWPRPGSAADLFPERRRTDGGDPLHHDAESLRSDRLARAHCHRRHDGLWYGDARVRHGRMARRRHPKASRKIRAPCLPGSSC